MNSRHLASTILERSATFKGRDALKFKNGEEWDSISYPKLSEIVKKVGANLMDQGIMPGDRVGIFSENRPEWTIADLAILSIGAVSVPIYATNTSAQAEYIVNDSGLTLLFVGSNDQYEKASSFWPDENYPLIVFDKKVEINKEKGSYFSDLMDKKPTQGSKNKQVDILKEVNGEELATIIYTSGTTGEPKGVMLTHSNFFHQLDLVDSSFNVGPGDRSLCFLPLSHVFERAWSFFILYKGVTNHYIVDHTQIMEYLKEVKPTCMVSVPRLFEKIYSTVNVRLNKASPVKRTLFKWAIKVGEEHQNKLNDGVKGGMFHNMRYRIAEKLVLAKLRDVVGGEIKFFASGGAPLSGEIGHFFSKVGIQIYEGYGLTETSPMISFNTPKERRFGTVGKVAQLVKVKFGHENEILVKGPNVMKGYFNRPDLNSEAFTRGWFRTGDVGEFDADGYLKITDRIKDLIITSTGKNVARQRVETVIGKDHYIEQILAIGNGRKFISALVVPYFEALEEYAKEKGIGYSSREMLIRKNEIVQFYRDRIEKISTELANYEKIKKFTLLPVEFTQAAGEITPTLKNKRNVIMQRYDVYIDKMYA